MSDKRSVLYISCLFCIFLGLKGCWLLFPRIFETLELQSQDGLIRLNYLLNDTNRGSPDITYVDLDDKSLSRLPYSKNDPELYSRIISILGHAGVAAQLVDMVFVSGNDIDTLRKSSKEAGNVYLPLIFTHSSSGEAQQNAKFSLPEAAKWKKSATASTFPQGNLVISNLAALNEATAGLGHINCWPDHDGVYRRLPLFFMNGDELIPALSLRVAINYLQVPPGQVHIKKRKVVLQNARFPDGRVLDITIPYDNKGKSRINFIGPWPYSFSHYSMATILEKGSSLSGLMDLRDELENNLVIISDVTTGGRDYGPVPFASYSPLSGLHTQFLNSILTNSFLVEAQSSLIFIGEFLLLVLLVIMALKFQGGWLLGGAVLTVALLFIANFLSLTVLRTLFPLVRPTSFIVLGVTSILLIQFVSIQQEKRIMKARLTPYFAPTVMEKILASPEMLSNVSKKELTILFSDIVGFTAWSSTKEAQEIHETLNRYFQEMSSVVFAHEGTIDKFMGDGMLAFFGDPTPQKDHAPRAVQAAIAMQQKAWELKKEWSQTNGMRIRVRIGIHTGEVVVGNMGSEERMDYTVIGSHVNLAQRLESNSAPDRILISQEVYDKLSSDYITTSNGTIEAKGFSDPVAVYYVNRYQPSPSQTI